MFWKELPLAICTYFDCFNLYVCLSLWCWGLEVDLIVSVSEFSYLLCHYYGKELPTVLAIYSFCVCLIVFVCLSFWCRALMWVWEYQFLSSFTFSKKKNKKYSKGQQIILLLARPLFSRCQKPFETVQVLVFVFLSGRMYPETTDVKIR